MADWLIHREMGCDWLVANMKRFEKIRIYFNGIINAYNMHIVRASDLRFVLSVDPRILGRAKRRSVLATLVSL
jgi:hypothetical protein